MRVLLETQHGRKLSLDALHRVLPDTVRPPEGTPNHDVAGNGPIAKVRRYTPVRALVANTQAYARFEQL